MIKICVFINLFLFISVVCLITLLLVISKRFAQIQQVSESAMTSHIYIHKNSVRNNEKNAAQSSKEWIQHMYAMRNKFNLNNQTWENFFDYAVSENIIVTDEQ